MDKIEETREPLHNRITLQNINFNFNCNFEIIISENLGSRMKELNKSCKC